MNLSALAVLKDLARSKRILSSKGRHLLREMKHPSATKIHSRTVVRMHGLAGPVTPVTLIREAEVAVGMLMMAHKLFSQEKWHPSIDAYFKASAIATNVIFTANVHDLTLPRQVYADMNTIIAEGTHGIKMIMKVIATKGLMHHEKTLHPGKSKGKKSAAAFMRHLKKEGGK